MVLTDEEKRENQKEYNRTYYYRNKAKCVAKNKRTRDKRKALLRELKSKPCTDCKRSYPSYVMDFDHRDPTAKEFNIGELVGTVRLERLLAELEKCDLVCANCHRIRTYQYFHA